MTDSPGIFDSAPFDVAGDSGPVAFVLGGGGVRGAVEVGMIRALLEAGITPDLVVGTSIGAINGAVLAADPTMAAVEQLTRTWPCRCGWWRPASSAPPSTGSRPGR